MGRNMVIRKSLFIWVQTHISNFVVGGPINVYRTFSPNAGEITVNQVSPIFDMLIRSEDIRDRSLKLSEISPNVARFWPQNLFGGPSNFGA